MCSYIINVFPLRELVLQISLPWIAWPVPKFASPFASTLRLLCLCTKILNLTQRGLPIYANAIHLTVMPVFKSMVQIYRSSPPPYDGSDDIQSLYLHSFQKGYTHRGQKLALRLKNTICYDVILYPLYSLFKSILTSQISLNTRYWLKFHWTELDK